MNPYSGKDLISFLGLFAQRLWALLTGQMPLSDLATDEIQVFVLALVALASALVGTLLVLRRMTMLANALSHTLLLGIALAFLLVGPSAAGSLTLPMLVLAAIASALLTTLLTHACNRWFALSEDVGTGLVFTTLFALGIVLVSGWMRNTHLGIEAVMGNADALHRGDLALIFWIALANVALIALFYRGWQVTTFDARFAKMAGFSPAFFQALLMTMTAITAIGAFRAVGVLLALSFFVTPTLIARLLCKRLHTVLLTSAGMGVGCALVGVALARHLLSVHGLALSTAGLTVSCLGALFFLIWGGKALYCINHKINHRAHREHREKDVSMN